jgi:hypothetical protein
MMARDEAVEKAAERLTAIYSKCLKLSQEYFPETVNDKTAQRITVLALMKDMADLIASGQAEIEEKEAPPREAPTPPPRNEVEWKPHKKGGPGEWCFSADNLELKEKLIAGQGCWEDQDYNYILSEDGRFISRWRRKR